MIISVIFIFCLNILIPLHEGFYNKLDYRSSTEDIIEENRSNSYANDDTYQNELGKNIIQLQLSHHCKKQYTSHFRSCFKMCHSCKVKGMEMSKGYRHMGFSSQSIRDCVQIISAHGGFGTNPGYAGNHPLAGKLVLFYNTLPKEYYDCVMKNDRLYEQKMRQSNQKLRQLTRRVFQLEKL